MVRKQMVLVSIVLLLLSGIAVTVSALVVEQQAKLHASDGSEQAHFGSAVALNGRVLAIGAGGGGFGSDEPGKVYIFYRNGTEWQEAEQLMASDGHPGDLFGGWSISISGNTLAIGAVGNDTLGGRAGAVYIFERQNGMWREQAKLTASDGIRNAFFGRSVAIDGDTLVVGTFKESAYIFERKGATWLEQAKITPGDNLPGDRFGNATAISGNFIVVGAESSDALGTFSGAAYVFRRSGAVWVEQAKLTAGDGTDGEKFGSAVAVTGNRIVIGANGVDFWEVNPGYGAAYVFERSGSSWIETAKLTAADRAPYDYFGSPIDISGDRIILGAYGDDDWGEDSGSAYIFERNGTSWYQSAKITASDGAAYDYFYGAVIDRHTAVIGARGDDDFGEASGSVYVYRLR